MAQRKKSPTTEAGRYVREEIEHIREGKHGARSTKQAIAIGLSKARRAGVKVPRRGGQSMAHEGEGGSSPRRHRRSARRSRAISGVLRREPRSAASRENLSRQGRDAARARGPESRYRAAMKAVRTKGPRELREEARKAARSRSRKRAA